jgi:hypothetical protein
MVRENKERTKNKSSNSHILSIKLRLSCEFVRDCIKNCDTQSIFLVDNVVSVMWTMTSLCKHRKWQCKLPCPNTYFSS